MKHHLSFLLAAALTLTLGVAPGVHAQGSETGPSLFNPSGVVFMQTGGIPPSLQAGGIPPRRCPGYRQTGQGGNDKLQTGMGGGHTPKTPRLNLPPDEVGSDDVESSPGPWEELFVLSYGYGDSWISELRYGSAVLARDIAIAGLIAVPVGDITFSESWCHDGDTVTVSMTITMGEDMGAAIAAWREAVELAKAAAPPDCNRESGGGISVRYRESWQTSNPSGFCSTVSVTYTLDPSEPDGPGFEFWRSGVQAAQQAAPQGNC